MAPKAKSKSSNTTTPQPQSQPQRPDWPPLHPLPSPYDLTLDSLTKNQIITIPHLFTSSLCAKYVSFLKSLPLVTTPGKPKRGDAVRVNDRFQITDAEFSRRLWEETSLKPLVTEGEIDGEAVTAEDRTNLWGGEVLGLNPNIRVYRYSEGQYFDCHCMYLLHPSILPIGSPFSPAFLHSPHSSYSPPTQTTTQTTSTSPRQPPPAQHRRASPPARPGPSSSTSPPATEAKQSSTRTHHPRNQGSPRRSLCLRLRRSGSRFCIAMVASVCCTRARRSRGVRSGL